MESIIYEVGFLVTYALDKLDKNKVLNPMYGAIKEDSSKVLKEIKDISLEKSIPKVLDILSTPSQDIISATAIFPAELKDENRIRYSVIIAMVSHYKNSEYLTIAQSYSFKDGKIITTNYELIDIYEPLEVKLHELEDKFVQGAFSYDDAEYIWKERFLSS